MSYKNKLQEMGIVESRIEDLNDAMDKLHSAISKLDNSQLKKFSNEYGIIGHLDMYAREEGLRNVAKEMYQMKLYEAIRKIDFDEFSDFGDKLAYLADEAAELGIPGAYQLTKSLAYIRKEFERKSKPFARLAQKMLNISQISGCTVTQLYSKDDIHLGEVTTLHIFNREETMDSGYNLVFVQVTLDTIS